MKIALAGNPNCGKTTAFNELTGSSQYVGNWPGVTVEKKEGKVRQMQDVTIVDLPGIYSLSPYTIEEIIARDYLLEEKPDAILNIVDASNLERNLYLTTQLLELNIPVVVVLNMMDVVKNEGHTIDSKGLEKELGCMVVEASANKGIGIKEAIQQTVKIANKPPRNHIVKIFAKTVEEAIEKISNQIPEEVNRFDTIKLLEQDEYFLSKTKVSQDSLKKIKSISTELENKMDNDSESILIQERYEYIEFICKKHMIRRKREAATYTDKIDRIVTNRWLAIPIFFLIMWFVYYISIQTVGSITIDGIDYFFNNMIAVRFSHILDGAGVSELIKGFLLTGIVGGVGAVFTFVPQIMILFFFLSLLEDCGYMARIAFIMDKLFRKFGLSGKSFVPMLIGSGCSVPAIMASRTVDNERDRKLTVMLTPFIPCSAKLPVFALFVGAFFPEHSWVGASMYIVGITMVILSGILLKRTKTFGGKVSSFVMELPPYRMPTMKGVFIHMWDRAKTFIMKAGTIIFTASAIIWLLQTFNWRFQMVDSSHSILASLGRIIAPIFSPLGFGNWQAAVAIATGFLAKENVVATFGILFGLSDATEGSLTLINQLGLLFHPLSAYAFMIFTLLAAPCFAAIGAIKREMGGWKWTFIAIGFQTGVAYVMALLVYQIGSFIGL